MQYLIKRWAMCIHRGLAKLWISTDPRAVCALFNGPVKLFKMLPICSLDHWSQITSSQRGINSAIASIRPADMTQHSCYSRSMNASRSRCWSRLYGFSREIRDGDIQLWLLWDQQKKWQPQTLKWSKREKLLLDVRALFHCT